MIYMTLTFSYLIKMKQCHIVGEKKNKKKEKQIESDAERKKTKSVVPLCKVSQI